MLKVIKNRMEQGHRTSKYPKEPINLYKRFRGLPKVDKNCTAAVVQRCVEACPQDAINSETKEIDLGRCVFCGLCETVSDEKFVKFSQNFEMGVSNRDDLFTQGDLPALAEHSKKHFKKLFGRSLQLRQISAGGCNACEADTNVLNTPFFDLSRFGIQFVASPRHADGIHVTGPISENMRVATLSTFEAVPSPKVVIASGACAISGGPFYGSDEIVGDLNKLIPVDLYIPGCPPHPLTTLHALLNYFK
jgi:Ni,Fe-hydrogenase III small subunit/NAD-dependent dihydropyrimidine dehydrogenase PreA subunit